MTPEEAQRLLEQESITSEEHASLEEYFTTKFRNIKPDITYMRLQARDKVKALDQELHLEHAMSTRVLVGYNESSIRLSATFLDSVCCSKCKFLTLRDVPFGKVLQFVDSSWCIKHDFGVDALTGSCRNFKPKTEQ